MALWNWVDITDLTDNYTVDLSRESNTWVVPNGGNAAGGAIIGQTCAVEVTARWGTNVLKNISVAKESILCPDSVQVQSVETDSQTGVVTIIFEVVGPIQRGDDAEIPVVCNPGDAKNEATINKDFEFVVVEGGAAGIDGVNGLDSTALYILASAGTTFRNSSGATKLTAKLYVGGKEVTIATNGTASYTDNQGKTVSGTVKWYEGDWESSDKKLLATGNSYTVQASSVDEVMTICAGFETA